MGEALYQSVVETGNTGHGSITGDERSLSLLEWNAPGMVLCLGWRVRSSLFFRARSRGEVVCAALWDHDSSLDCAPSDGAPCGLYFFDLGGCPFPLTPVIP